MKLLNILNGDSTLYLFRLTKLEGDVIIWRETLSEGPAFCTSSFEHFFTERFDWIRTAYDSNYKDYKEKVIDEFKRLEDLAPEAEEILLWFEFDLHCQVNLIFLLNYLNSLDLPNTRISLICPGTHVNHPDFRGIGQLNPEEFAGLISEKVLLNSQDLDIAGRAWSVYCQNDPELIQDFLKEPMGNLKMLKSALEAHLKRFPDKETGLNYIDRLLISIVGSGYTRRQDIYQEFWRNNAIYGMGDAQIDLYITKLTQNKLIPQLPQYE